MKKLFMVVAVSVFLFSITACKVFRDLEEIPVATVLENPSLYQGKSVILTTGTVVFKKQKEGISVVVVMSHPFPKIASITDLRENEVFLVKLPAIDYWKVDIGSVITAKGHIEKAEKERKAIYYIDSYDVIVTGHENIDDPDFEKLAEVVNQKVKDDIFFDFAAIFLVYFLLFDDD